MRDYYDILGIQPTATSGQIKVAYRRLALKYHPDKNPLDALSEKKFIEIAEAYNTLSDPIKRSKYDNGIDFGFDSTNEENARPSRRPPPFFYQKFTPEKPVYSRKTYTMATAAVLAIIVLAVAFPIYLLRMNSARYFNTAISNYLAGRYYSALHNIDLSIQDLSSTNSEACALASVILVHRLHKYDYALKYIDRGFGYDPDDSLASEFHYLKGICLANTQDPQNALSEFSQVQMYSNNYDSSLFRSAVILTYSIPKHDSAELLLNKLIDRNKNHYEARYFKGLIYEKGNEHMKAFTIFNDLRGTPFNPAATYYHLAKSEIKLNLADSACAHLKIASNYRLPEAKQLLSLYCKKESIFMSPYD